MADIFIAPDPADAPGGLTTAPGIPSAGGTSDPSQVSGQDPDSFLGIPISYESGAGGSPAPGGESQGTADPSNMPNQYPGKEPISGVALGGSGAPGSQGIIAQADGDGGPGAQTIQVTDPSLQGAPPAGQSGTQLQDVAISVSGPGDSTATKGNYPPQIPIIEGDFYPVPGGQMQPPAGDASSHVMKGGWMNGARSGDAPGTELRADTFPGGDSSGIMSAGAAGAVTAHDASPVNTADATPPPSRPQPTDAGGTRNAAWAKTATYPFAADNQQSGPWKQT